MTDIANQIWRTDVVVLRTIKVSRLLSLLLIIDILKMLDEKQSHKKYTIN